VHERVEAGETRGPRKESQGRALCRAQGSALGLPQAMNPWIKLDTSSIPGGKEELRLMRRSTEFSIMLGHNELMNSRLSGSEEALATLSCERIREHRNAHILIGGLGMGFTLRAALGVAAPDASITVAELVPAVIAWARGPMAELHGTSLDDPRVTLHQGDVGQLIRSGRSAYDAILLDIDNGPSGLTRASNDSLYDVVGLGLAHAALKHGGVLAIWSAAPDPHFTKLLHKTGFAVEELRVRAKAGRSGARHVIWLASVETAPRPGPP
jgi:spermidine synthase